jgi:hypothetical protein
MKKAILVFVTILVVSSIYSEEKEKGPVGLDAGIFISYGQINVDSGSGSEIDKIVGVFASLLSVRGGGTVTLRYRLTSILSAGLEGGYAAMKVESNGSSTLYQDIPVNAVVRLGGKGTFIEGHGGYYYSDSIYGGISAGAKASLGGVYFDYTYIWGDSISYPRYTLGFQVNNIL